MVPRQGGGLTVPLSEERSTSSRVAPWCRTVGDETAEVPATTGDEFVKSIDEWLRADDSKEPSQSPSESDLLKKCHATSFIARYRCSGPQNEPPAVAPCLLAHIREQLSGIVIAQRKQGQLGPPIESCDDTRREPAEPSGPRVEENRAWKTDVVLGARHGIRLQGAGLPSFLARRRGRPDPS
jgi:hypothetical protein